MNKGLEKATGDIFAFVNADDFLLAGAVDTVNRFFETTPGADVVYGHGVRVDAEGQVLRPLYSDRWNLRRHLYGASKIVQQATFVRTECIREAGGFVEGNRTCWDAELWVDLARLGVTWRRIDEMLGAFREHDATISSAEHGRGGGASAAYLADKQRILEKVVSTPDATTIKTKLAKLEKRLVDPKITWRNLIARLGLASKTLDKPVYT